MLWEKHQKSPAASAGLFYCQPDEAVPINEQAGYPLPNTVSVFEQLFSKGYFWALV